MPYNPTHYRKTWAALGNPTDPVAFDVAGPRSAISLLKGLLAEFGGPYIPDHSVSLTKLQQITGPTVLGRGAGLGDVFACSIGRGIQISTINQVSVVPDVPMKSEANVWLGQNTFQNPVNIPDGVLGLTIYSVGDLTKRVRVDLSGMPAGNTLTLRPPTVGFDGSGNISYLALLDGVSNRFAQPADDDLTAISNLTAVNTIYYRSGDSPPTWSPVVVGAGLLFLQGTLSATGGGTGGGGVNTAGPVNASMLAGYADATGNLIQGVTVSGPGIAYTGGLLQTTNDLRALELLTGTNTLYYRSAPDTWSPVVFGTGLSFAGAGLLALSPALQALSAVAMIADTVPYFTGAGTAAGAAFTVFGRSLVGSADAAAALTLLGAQPLDSDLTALAALGGTNTIYYRSGTGTWSPVTIGANLTFGGGVLAGTGTGGGVTTSGAVSAAMLTGYADSTGTLIRGITMPGAGLTLTGAALTLANDLSALEALSGTNNIYYRSGVDAWSAVTIGTNLTFSGGVLNATAAGGGVTTSGAVTASMLTGYADATGTLIRGINFPAAGISLSGNNMVLTNDLASLESASATDVLYYRSASDTWSTVTVGGGLGFTTGNLTITNVALTALAALTPAADRLPYFTGASAAALTTFTAAARTLLQQPDAAAMVGVLGAQPLDGDLTSLAGATGTNTIYYRSAASTWSPVVIGTNLTFTGGTLAATAGGGGDVFKNLANTFTAQNCFINLGVVIGNTAPVGMGTLAAPALETHSAGYDCVEHVSWHLTQFTVLGLAHVRSGSVGAFADTLANDTLGYLLFQGGNTTGLRTGARIAGVAEAGPIGASFLIPSRMELHTVDAAGTLQERFRLDSSGRAMLNAKTLIGPASALSSATFDFQMYSVGTDGTFEQTRWANDASPIRHYFDKSRGTTVGSFPAVAANDVLGEIIFRGSDGGASFGTAALIRATVNGAVVSLKVPGAIGLHVTDTTGTLILCGSISPVACNFIGNTSGTDVPAGYVGEYLTAAASSVSLTSGAYTSVITMSVPAGDWEMRGIARVTGPNGATMYMNVYTISASSSGSPDETQTGIMTSLGDCWTACGPFRANQSAARNWYLNIYASAAGMSCVTAQIQCRRRH